MVSIRGQGAVPGDFVISESLASLGMDEGNARISSYVDYASLRY